jgi:hypothetical protein
MTQEDRLSFPSPGPTSLNKFRELSERFSLLQVHTRDNLSLIFGAAAVSDHGQFKPQRIIRRMSVARGKVTWQFRVGLAYLTVLRPSEGLLRADNFTSLPVIRGV